MIYDGVMLGNGATVTGVLICFTSHEGNIEVELLGFLREAPSRSALASSQSHNSALASSQGHERFGHPPPLIAIIAIVAIIDTLVRWFFCVIRSQICCVYAQESFSAVGRKALDTTADIWRSASGERKRKAQR